MADHQNILAIVIFANTREDIEKLVSALGDIAEIHSGGRPLPETAGPPAPAENAVSPRTAFFAEKTTIPWEDAEGCVSAEMIAPYPSGIPVIRPGEVFSSEILDDLKQIKRAGGRIHGLSDETMKTVTVIM